ncbi:4-hydroxy-3-methylbut-2-en-1-yl diphosphate synthase [Caldanaerobius fijiensis DSM 17918]|uniref:4-hydroxy-3-methylbut-2-en-1-yl diphosphate synthase (flavodoxin) n=1 Tax=Caldanaerobius fijiensis DSM 17918 TaxID=1121256 RepID=A0A1M4XIP3_9THEO|nr:4-hydroxy-3-methylbut-2-en-1-yl diphosphate synthase [Caldanaerobius fijiensis DSM 17918]
MLSKKTREVNIGGVRIGGGQPIAVQSMTNTYTADIEATCKQIDRLQEAGCHIVRVAVPDEKSAAAIAEIKKRINIPLVADIHFDYRLAIKSIESGADKIRINPGNIGSADRVKAVVDAAKDRGIPIRIGVNSGSIEKEFLERYGRTPRALVESALKHVHLLEKFGFYDIVLSLKATDVNTTIDAYMMISEQVDYPLHIGITEAGTPWAGTIKSSVGLGILLWQGIGDTMRVSLTGDPVEEVRVGHQILRALGLERRGVELISCPTCGRCNIDLISIASEVENRLQNVDKDIKVAIMGCAVNGPGEARDADIGIAGGKGFGVLFKKGEIVKKVREEDIVDELMKYINNL